MENTEKQKIDIKLIQEKIDTNLLNGSIEITLLNRIYKNKLIDEKKNIQTSKREHYKGI